MKPSEDLRVAILEDLYAEETADRLIASHEYRKIIQIAAVPGAKNGDTIEGVYALCNDGTVWVSLANVDEDDGYDGVSGWEALPAIPQGPVS